MGDTLPVLGTSPTSSCSISPSRSPSPGHGELRTWTVVWAKMKGFPYWPAQVVDPGAVNLTPAVRKEAQKVAPNHHFVKFFETHDFSWIPSCDILWPFEKHSHLEAAGKKKGRKPLLRAIAEAKNSLRDPTNAPPDRRVNNNNDNHDGKDVCQNNNVQKTTLNSSVHDVTKPQRMKEEIKAEDGTGPRQPKREQKQPPPPLDFDADSSNDGLVIDTSRSSSFSGVIKQESTDVKPSLDAGADTPLSRKKTRRSSSLSFEANEEVGSGDGDGVVTETVKSISLTPVESSSSSSSQTSTTLSFDIKSVISGLHSPPKASSSPATILISGKMTTTTTSVKRKSPSKQRDPSTKKIKTENEETADRGDRGEGVTPPKKSADVDRPSVVKRESDHGDKNKKNTPPSPKKRAGDGSIRKGGGEKAASNGTASGPKSSRKNSTTKIKTENADKEDITPKPLSPRRSSPKQSSPKSPTRRIKEEKDPHPPAPQSPGKHNINRADTSCSSPSKKQRIGKEQPPIESSPPSGPSKRLPPDQRRVKSSPKPLSPVALKISPLPAGQPYPNQTTSINYCEHFREWTIEDYANVTKLFSKPGTYIQGQQFQIGDDVWMFRMYPCGDTGDKGDPEFVGVFVELVSRSPKNAEKEVRTVLRVTILDKDKKKVWGEEMAAYSSHPLTFSLVKAKGKKRNVMGYAQFISRDTLFKHRALFMPDGKLTFGVTMLVLGEVTTKTTTTARPFTNATVTATDFAGLIDDPIFSDFTINVEGKTIRVHKSILAARSTVFRDMFLQRQDNINAFDSMQIDDFSYNICHDLLLFIYSGYSALLEDKPFDVVPAVSETSTESGNDTQRRVDSLRQLRLAAEKYQVSELKFKVDEVLAEIAPPAEDAV